MKKSLQEPDPTRLKYREQIYQIVGQIVRELRLHATEEVEAFASQNIESGDREEFVAIVADDLKRLHEGVITRYRLNHRNTSIGRGPCKRS